MLARFAAGRQAGSPLAAELALASGCWVARRTLCWADVSAHHGSPGADCRALARRARAATLGALALCALSPLRAGASAADPDDAFRLNARWEDLPNYFPGYLGNGFVATLTAPRGTEPTRAYLVGFMDYAAGDVSRPAAVPAWTEIDFSPTDETEGGPWLNRAALDTRHFQDYQQTLDLKEATLTTRYHYREGVRDTAVEVTSFVSEAAPHLAVTRLILTPDFQGTVRLSIAFTLWAAPAPRLALGELTGRQMEEAVAAHGLQLQPRAPTTPDREALWYAGYTGVRHAEGDAAARALWVEGQAERGLPLALAGAVRLPEEAHPEVKVYRSAYRLALEVRLHVERGHTYTFEKYVTFAREGWGEDARAALAAAQAARAQGFEAARAAQRGAWDALWQGDVLIEGDARAQQLARSELYYLLASSTPDTAWPLGACALTPGYAGHAFWDSDTWIFPALLLQHPDRARSLVSFRARTLPAARARAQARGLEGAMYPWESDPENGTEQTPHFAYVLGESEIHVNADIALAQWQYYLATFDRHWLRREGWPVIRDVARFWTSRATPDPRHHGYALQHVNSVAESHTDISNDTFTNLVAARALQAAVAAARAVGEAPDPRWARIAAGLYVPFSADGAHHLPFDPAVSPHSEDFGGGPLALLFLPALDLTMSPALRRSDYGFAIRPAPVAAIAAVSMGIAPHTIAAASVGSATEAQAWLQTNFSGGTLKPPFNVRTESADNNTGYFLTGSGGYLQSLIFGLTGLRLREAGLVSAYPPVLPQTWRSLTLRNVRLRGQTLDIRLARDAAGVARLTRTEH